MSSTAILVTAPQAYSKRFSLALEAHHLVPKAIPLIETVPTSDTAGMRALLQHDLEDFDYAVFCSRCAIDSFYDAVFHRYGSPEEQVDEQRSAGMSEATESQIAKVLSKCAFGAVGKDADYLFERLHVRPSICPDEPSPAGIGAKLAEMGNMENRRIAVLAPNVKDFEEPDVVPRFIDQLQKINMDVVRIDAYTTRAVSEQNVSAAVKLLEDGSVRGVAFTSGAEVSVLLRHSPECLADISVSCFGPYTAAYATKLGVKVSCIATDFSSFDGFASSIQKLYETES